MRPSFPWNGRRNSKASRSSLLRNSKATKKEFSSAPLETDRPLPVPSVPTMISGGIATRAVNLHTSLIVDPPDGKVPPYTPEAQKRIDAERVYSRQHPADGPEDRIPAERCLVFPMGGPPMLPSFYNNSQYGPLTTNYRIVQTPGY